MHRTDRLWSSWFLEFSWVKKWWVSLWRNKHSPCKSSVNNLLCVELIQLLPYCITPTHPRAHPHMFQTFLVCISHWIKPCEKTVKKETEYILLCFCCFVLQIWLPVIKIFKNQIQNAKKNYCFHLVLQLSIRKFLRKSLSVLILGSALDTIKHQSSTHVFCSRMHTSPFSYLD